MRYRFAAAKGSLAISQRQSRIARAPGAKLWRDMVGERSARLIGRDTVVTCKVKCVIAISSIIRAGIATMEH